MVRRGMRHRMMTLVAMSGTLMALGACPLSDRQLTSVYQTVFTTALNTFVAQLISNAATPNDNGN